MKCKRMISLLLVCVMLAALAGCQTTGSTGTTAGDSTTTATTAAATTEAAKPVTLTIYGPAFGLNFTSGVQTDPVAAEIAKQTGVIISVESAPDTTKEQAMLASGDLPDIFVMSLISQAKTLIEGGLIRELGDLVASNGPDLQETSASMLAYSQKYVSNDTDKLYFLLGCQYSSSKNFNWTVGANIRWDYYAELGYPAIKSGDDWLNVVNQLVTAHPTTESGKKVYGFSPWFDWGTWSFGLTGNIIAGFEGQGLATVLGLDFDIAKDCQYIGTGIFDDNASIVKGAKFFNKAYQMGLMDPDCATQTYQNALDKAAAGQTACGIVSWPYASFNSEMQSSGQTKSGYMLAPMDTEAYYMDTVASLGMISRGYCISKNCEYPEKAMDLINYLFSYEGSRTIFNGIKGVNYTGTDGNYVQAEATIAQSKSDTNFALNTGIGKYGNYAGLYGSIVDKFGQTISLSTFDNNHTDLTRDYCTHYQVTFPTEVLYKKLKYMYVDGSESALEPIMSDDLNAINSKVTQYLNTAMVKLMLVKTDAEFDSELAAIRTKVKDLGIEQVYSFMTDARNQGIAKMKQVQSAASK